MPKSIKSYIIFTVIFIISLTFFFSSNALIGDTRKLKNEGYNQTVTLGGWEFKVSNATYNKETKVVTFDIYSKEKEQEKSTKPNVYKISTSKDLNKELSFDSARITENNLGERYTVNDVEYGFYYIRLYIKIKESDIQPEDYVDEFGNIIKQEIIKGKEVEYWINIDYRLMNSEIKNVQTTIKPFEDEQTSETIRNTDSEKPIDTLTHQSQANQTTPTIASEQNNYPSMNPDYTITPSTSTVPPHHTTPKTTTSSIPVTPSIQDNSTSNTQSSTPKQTTSAPKSSTSTKTTAKTTQATTIKQTTSAPQSTTSTKATAKTTQTTTSSETLPPIPVTGIRLGSDFPNNNVQLTVGQSTVIRAIITPAEATNQKVTWTSNKPTVAYIDSTGKVIARTKGTVIITATTQDGNLTGACMVVVS